MCYDHDPGKCELKLSLAKIAGTALLAAAAIMFFAYAMAHPL